MRFIRDPFALCDDFEENTSAVIKTYEDAVKNNVNTEECKNDNIKYDSNINICDSEIVFGERNEFYDSKKHINYSELVEPTLKFLENMGYTYIALSGKAASLGFSPSSVYGTVEDLLGFICELKKSGKRVIVSVGFSNVDADSFLYEGEGFRMLFASVAMFWLRELAADGIRLSVKELKRFGGDGYISSLTEDLCGI